MREIQSFIAKYNQIYTINTVWYLLLYLMFNKIKVMPIFSGKLGDVDGDD